MRVQKKRVLGIGRVCIDEFVDIQTAIDRFGSKKIDAELLGYSLGGSIPRILSCLSAAGYVSHIICPIPRGPKQNNYIKSKLSEAGISYSTIRVCSDLRSIVLLRNSHIESIISISEKAPQILSLEAIKIKKLILFNPDCLIIDARHLVAAVKAATWAHNNGVLVFLDPGSSQLYKFKRTKLAIQLLQLSDIICASEDFYNLFGTGKGEDISTNPMFRRSKLLVSTMSDGCCLCITSNFSFVLCRKTSLRIGNTMGTGDVFRGWFLVKLLSCSHEERFENENVVEAIKIGMAAAAWKIQDIHKLPLLPTSKQVSRMKNKLLFEQYELKDYRKNHERA
jgi:sugar/nucleoside kinase (ribokinase family)